MSYPLDIVSTTTCYGAFAPYRVSSSYTGPMLTIRRDSDNTTADFYADSSGVLGTALNGTGTLLEAWLGSATGYVTKWWDQSGKGNHATQTTTTQQPRFDLLNARLDFTTGSGTAYFSLPSGTVPLGKPYSTVWGYISTDAASRTALIPTADNNAILSNLYDAALTSTAYMNGWSIGATNPAAIYMRGSRTAIINNEFSVVYTFNEGGYQKAARVVFRKNGNTIDVYQSEAFYWSGTVLDYNTSYTANTAGYTGYGVVQVTIQCNTAYTITLKHGSMGSTTSMMLGGGSGGAAVNQANNFRLDTNTYRNDWYANDFVGYANTYNVGNTISMSYDGSYRYLYVNGTPQGISPISSGWNASIGNEYIGRGNYGTANYNGEMYSLFIFKSCLSTNERTHIERGPQIASATNGIKFSQIKASLGITTTTLTLSQANAYMATAASASTQLSTLDGFQLRPGLFTRIYWSQYFGNVPSWFNSNTPSVTCVTTNLRNTYCATGGFNNPNAVDTAIGGIAANVTYSVEWAGAFYAPTTGTYTFYMLADNFAHLWLGTNATSGYTTTNTLLTCPSDYVEKSATISLTANTYYPIRVQFGDGGGGEYFTFSFAPPGRSRVYDGTGYFFCQTSASPKYFISPSNLSVYLPFDTVDVSGTSVTNRASLTATAATLVNGASVSTADYKVGGSSLAFTASSSQYATIPSWTPTTNGLTFSFWYRSNGSGGWARVFDFGTGQNQYNVLCSPNALGLNQLCVTVIAAGTDNNYYMTDINYNDNTWRHITWTLTYAAENTRTSAWTVYVNGISKATTTNYYPATSVTRNLNYIGKSNWADAYYNGYIDDFRIYDRVVTAAEAAGLYSNTAYNYILKNGSTTMVTQPQGLTPGNPATSGYAIFSANPWMANGTYWIKSSAMPNALQMYVDVKAGGYDFYQITGGTSVNAPSSTHSGTALGLELVIPRSQNHWRSIYNYVYNTLGSNYNTWLNVVPIYRSTTTISPAGNYGVSGANLAMFDPRYGNSGSTAGSFNGVPDWQSKDGGLWYVNDIPHIQTDGDYTLNTYLGFHQLGGIITPYYTPYINDGTGGYYTGTSYLVSTNYAGSTVSTLYHYYDGSTAERAAPSALYIKNMTGTSTNGVYWINLPTVGPTQIYCIMDSTVDGGGWMMAMKATRGTTFPYDSSHWTTVTTLNPSDNTRNDADAKFHTMNYFPSKDLLALWPDIPYNYGSGTGGSLSLSGYNNWCWMKNNYNSGSKQTLISYFSTASNVSFGTPKGVERGTAFSSQGGNSFYGVNFTAFANMKVRWGFAWNNESEWYSNDVIGGIGQYANWGSLVSYSAGDQIGCCQDQTGINRSARVEMYVR